ncbi:MAG: hypothetical protein NTU63_03950 [Candidatus Pacearchaeota archaeon]|nr:hypothetical protein [Candidatus Pacearchaeota archaeon]
MSAKTSYAIKKEHLCSVMDRDLLRRLDTEISSELNVRELSKNLDIELPEKLLNSQGGKNEQA